MNSIYCPICAREIHPENSREVEDGEHGAYVYVHDPVPHDDSDIEALDSGVN